MNRFLYTFLFLFAAVSFFASCSGRNEGRQAASQTHTITVGGSTSVAPLMELFKAAYESQHSNIRVSISASGSGDGIRGAAAGTFEIGMSSRDLTPAERGADIREFVAAIDGIGVIVNNDSSVSDLSREQLRDIYTGAIRRWEQLGAAAQGKTGPIAVISRESASGTRTAFEEILNFRDQLVNGAVEFDGTGAVKAEVFRNIHAIAYISLGSADNTVKLLNIGGFAPNTDNITAGTYEIARPFILLTRRSAALNPGTQAFLDWILSAEGQSIVSGNWIRVN